MSIPDLWCSNLLHSRIFRDKISRKIREFLKKARRGFLDPLKGMWDHIKSFEHRLDTLTTLPASLGSPKGLLRPCIPEIFGKNHPEFLEISDSFQTYDMGYQKNPLDAPVKIF